MPIDPQLAIGAELDPVTVEWTDQDVLLYHLSLGLGRDATNPGELRYTYEKSLRVLPSYALVVGMRQAGSGGLSVFPGLDIDLRAVLHGGQELTLHRPIPVAAKATTVRRVADIWDKGKAAVIVLESETSDLDGEPLFTTRSQIFVRGEGGFGGERGPDAGNSPPERAPDEMREMPTLPQQALLYRLNGDRNPLHADPEFAAMAGFDRPILHGLCTYALALKAVVDAALDGDPSAVAGYEARFAGVVFPGETVVTSMWHDGDRVVLQAQVAEREGVVLSNAAVRISGNSEGAT